MSLISIRKSLVLGTGAGPSGGTGGGSSGVNCAAICQELSVCPDADPVATCTSECQASNAVFATTPCNSDYEAYIGCAATSSDICDAEAIDAQCAAQSSSLLYFIIEYCTANPSAPACATE